MSDKAFDVATVIVEGFPEASFVDELREIDITVTDIAPNIDIDPSTGPEMIEIEVPGVQGPPGLQNVYIQEANPAIQYGWGPEETNYIWIPV